MQKNSLTDQLKNLQQSQQFLAIAILFLVVVFSWVFIEMFTEQQKSSISPNLTKAAQPLTPTISSAVLDRLEAKHHFNADELANFPIYKFISTENGKETVVVPITVFAEDLEPEQNQEQQPTTESGFSETLLEEEEIQESSDFNAPQIGVETPLYEWFRSRLFRIALEAHFLYSSRYGAIGTYFFVYKIYDWNN